MGALRKDEGRFFWNSLSIRERGKAGKLQSRQHSALSLQPVKVFAGFEKGVHIR